MKICTAAIGSLTNAIQAQHALSDAGIDGSIVKLDASITRKGCAYGVEFSCDQLRSVRAVMSAKKIKVSNYLNGIGGTLL